MIQTKFFVFNSLDQDQMTTEISDWLKNMVGQMHEDIEMSEKLTSFGSGNRAYESVVLVVRIKYRLKV